MQILLLGEQWDALVPALMVLVDERKMAFVGLSGQSIEEAVGWATPSVIMVSPDFGYQNVMRLKQSHPARPLLPPFLLCISHEALETDELYQGIDDLLVLPCSAAELDKRLKRLAQKGQSPPSPSSLRVGKITLDPVTYQVTVAGRRVELAWMEFQLLKFLMHYPGKVFSREELLVNVWGIENVSGTRTIDVHIRRLRYKLGVGGEEFFRTVKNVGYGLMDSR